jgi:drug/metabolite transporter (DMT)-like permease
VLYNREISPEFNRIGTDSMHSNDHQALRGYCALAAAASIWGGMYVVSKYTLDFIPPFTLLWLRYVTAFASRPLP